MKKIVIGLILVGAAIVSMSSMFFHNRMSNETFTTSKAVEKLIVDDRNMPIEVVGVSGNKTRISYKKSRDIKYKIKQTSDSLSFERKRSIGFNFSFFNLGKRDPKVTIEIPKAKLKDLQVETSNGKLSTENLTVNNLDLETSNSKMIINNVDADTVDAETSNGKVELSQMTFDDGSFETSNSKMDLQNLDFKEGEFQTSNGKINLMNLKPAKSLSLETSNSKVNGTIVGDKDDFSIVTKTSNASNNLGNHDNGSKELEVKTSNGDIDIVFVR
ncbi:DUF4097 family beta strand repeat-containing protein [Candidatus Enterococcus murrayae]|uniref:DUF4097 family beta strand repeat protein n=1 Tax=Candidatus Enterococcus murrayae TaxID=2815321 RepID=A0ABS3HC92_9ENTE|nr:DUF4097 family beta strand repeat-containing protein [Enterococcus sp. MJM16]MBO0451062.1 DUF4097 family beta strand repeat protein [Enterococcus sp. MJM16]